MARRGVVPVTVDRLELDGFWIDLKRELTVGEQRAWIERAVDVRDGQVVVNRLRWDPAQVGAYVLDWSLVDGQDQPLPVTADAIDNLPIDVYDEIKAAVDAHIGKLQARLADQKKTRSTATNSEPILRSVS